MFGFEFVLVNSVGLIEGMADGWQYIVVFVLAAIPWIEILVVVLAGIIVGLNPFLVGLAAAAGNIIHIYLIIVLYRKFEVWLGDDSGCSWLKLDGRFEGQRERALKYWNRYGLFGLAVVSPALVGVHLATVATLAIGSDKRNLAVYMTFSVVGWTVLLILMMAGMAQLT